MIEQAGEAVTGTRRDLREGARQAPAYQHCSSRQETLTLAQADCTVELALGSSQPHPAPSIRKRQLLAVFYYFQSHSLFYDHVHDSLLSINISVLG